MKPLFLTLIIAVLVLSGSFTHAVEPDDSLVLYLSFDKLEGKKVTDHSNHGNHGETQGKPELVKGKFGNALKFNGTSDWVVIPHHESLTVDEDVTVMAWINTERHEGPGGARWQGILAKSNGPRSYSFYTEIPSTGLHFSVGGSGSVSTGKVKLDEWQHVVAQIEDGAHIYYINGEPAGDFPGKNPAPGKAYTADALVGKTHEGSREFLGLIDEVRIWNRALTEDEVKKQMDMGFDDIFAVDARNKLATTWGTLKAGR